MRGSPPFLNAGNAGPFTLDGTRTYRVGTQRVALVDPGPDVERHVRALVDWVGNANEVLVLLTHGHADHAGAARPLAKALGAPILGPETVADVDLPLLDGDVVDTDQGTLGAIHTPGHTADHLSYHWVEESALFAGDLLLGKGDTTWVGEYPGCVGDYLVALDRIRRLSLSTIYPAHGPPLEDPGRAIGRFEAHRRERIRQVEKFLNQEPDATAQSLLPRVYGNRVPPGAERAATLSLQALIDFVRAMPRQ